MIGSIAEYKTYDLHNVDLYMDEDIDTWHHHNRWDYIDHHSSMDFVHKDHLKRDIR